MDSKASRDYLLDRALAAGITGPRELAHFMGQMEVECGGFGRMNENLNYSGPRLLEVFPRARNGMDTLEEANAVAAGGPQVIAEKIYGGKWGARELGNTEEGDGWRFHGRGYVQVTGRANYRRAAEETGLDLVANPQLAAEPVIAADIAVHYWTGRVRTQGAQADVDAATVLINGGSNHLRERRAATAEWETRLANGYLQANGITGRGDIPPPDVNAPEVSARRAGRGESTQASNAPAFSDGIFNTGDCGIGVETLQRQLIEAGYTGRDGKALVADGHFGENTEHAVRELQSAHRLQVDGKAGLHTLRALAEELQHGRPVRDVAPVESVPESSFRPQRPDETSRFHDRLYDALRTGVYDMDRSLGRTPDDASDRVAAALYAQCKACGMTQIDGVVLGQKGTKAEPGEYVFAYRGQPDRVSDWVSVRTADAIQTPVEQSVERAEALQREQGIQASQAHTRQPGGDFVRAID